MHWTDLKIRHWARPGAKRAWTVPLVLAALAVMLGAFPPWRASLWSEVLNRLPPGFSEDQVIVSRAFRNTILLGIGPEALEIARKRSTRLHDIQMFEGHHILARLKPGASVWDAQKEMREALGDVTVRVHPVRLMMMGDTHMLVIIWLIGWLVMGVRAAVHLRRQPKWWRYRVYQFSTLAGLGSMLILLFANVSEAFGSARQGSFPSWWFWVWSFSYVLMNCGLLWCWRFDTRTRCRVCAQVLRLPMELGEEGSMVLDTPRIELVCFEGHGALTMDRWHDDWRGYRDMWEAFSRPSP